MFPQSSVYVWILLRSSADDFNCCLWKMDPTAELHIGTSCSVNCLQPWSIHTSLYIRLQFSHMFTLLPGLSCEDIWVCLGGSCHLSIPRLLCSHFVIYTPVVELHIHPAHLTFDARISGSASGSIIIHPFIAHHLFSSHHHLFSPLLPTS